MLTAKIRKSIFFLTDTLKGRPVQLQYKDIKEIMENEDIFLLKKDRYLQQLITHATSTTPFYKEFAGCTDISKFPVINKNQLREKPGQFISDEFRNKKLHSTLSSGSTGAPLKIYQDRRKRNRVLAELIYFMHFCGIDIGMKFLYFRLPEKSRRKKYFNHSIAKNMVMADPSKLDVDYLESIRKKLKKENIFFIRGYTSAIGYVGSYLKKCGDHPSQFRVKAIQCSAEILSERTRQELISVFGCPVLSRYSNQENGVLAHECPEYKEFHVNCASYHVEILKMDSDEPAPEGEMGRIIVTDLFNYAMPLIRYETGDLGIAGKNEHCKYKTPIIRNLVGRAINQLYSTDGTHVSPLIYPVPLEGYSSIIQYQIIQEGKKEYRLKLNDASKSNSDLDITAHLKNIFGQDALITIEYVDEIPLLASGKRQHTVNNYKMDTTL